jgi:two-component system, OmpR family, KDP operon response regulator KdpE
MNTKILIIDDDDAIRKLLRIALKAANYETLEAKSAQDGINVAALNAPSLVLLDLGLPDMDGTSFLKAFREWSQSPVIVVSAIDREEKKIAVLEDGADDYITKPFGTGELLARIKAALRRCEGDGASSLLICGNLQIDLAARIVLQDSNELKLTPKEYDLLKLMAQNQGKALTHTQLLRSVWGVGYQSETHYLRVFVNQLRQKIEDDPSRPKRIVTETGIGYRFMG